MERLRKERLRRVAYHEAGHAAVSFEVKHSIRTVTIVPDRQKNFLGECEGYGEPKWFNPDVIDLRAQEWIEAEILVLMAGEQAVRRLTGRIYWRGSGDDLRNVLALGRLLYKDEVLAPFLGSMAERTKSLIERPLTWAKIEAIAQALLEHGTLSGKRVRDICRDVIQTHMARARLEQEQRRAAPQAGGKAPLIEPSNRIRRPHGRW